jgi:hypothetical protein
LFDCVFLAPMKMHIHGTHFPFFLLLVSSTSTMSALSPAPSTIHPTTPHDQQIIVLQSTPTLAWTSSGCGYGGMHGLIHGRGKKPSRARRKFSRCRFASEQSSKERITSRVLSAVVEYSYSLGKLLYSTSSI